MLKKSYITLAFELILAVATEPTRNHVAKFERSFISYETDTLRDEMDL